MFSGRTSTTSPTSSSYTATMPSHPVGNSTSYVNSHVDVNSISTTSQVDNVNFTRYVNDPFQTFHSDVIALQQAQAQKQIQEQVQAQISHQQAMALHQHQQQQPEQFVQMSAVYNGYSDQHQQPEVVYSTLNPSALLQPSEYNDIQEHKKKSRKVNATSKKMPLSSALVIEDGDDDTDSSLMLLSPISTVSKPEKSKKNKTASSIESKHIQRDADEPTVAKGRISSGLNM